MKTLTKKSLLLAAVIAVAFSSCKEKNQPTDENGSNQKPTSQTVARKQLIEHFTGEACGYCPYGMELIANAIKGQEDKYIWVSNHAGYYDDEYTVRASKSLASKFKINSAPSMMLNREQWNYIDEEGNHTERVFHPFALQQISSKTVDTTSVSIKLATDYAASAGKLTINISGDAPDYQPDMKLTVIIKESGLHGIQSDYYYTWQGWEEFIHTNVVRQYVTAYLGDSVTHDFAKEYVVDWNSKWNPDNSSVVAFLTNATTNEVLNAEEIPVVNGTKGGKDIAFGGVKANEVPDTYPEYQEVPEKVADLEYSSARWGYIGKLDNGNKVIEIDLISDSKAKYEGNTVQPVTVLFVIVDDESVLPTGSFEINSSEAVGSVWAGFRNDEIFELNGSRFTLAWTSYLSGYDYVYGTQWLLKEGYVSVTENSVQFEGKSFIGSTIKGTFSGEFGSITSAQWLPRQRQQELLQFEK